MIIKAEIKITLLMTEKSLEEATRRLGLMELSNIVYEMQDGEWLGQHELLSTARVLPWDVANACVGVGGEPDFFGDDHG